MSEYANIGGVMMNGRLAMSQSAVAARLNSLTRDLAEKSAKHDEYRGWVRMLTAALENKNRELADARKFAQAFVDLFQDSDMRPEDECHELYGMAEAFLSRLSAAPEEPTDDR